MLNAGKIVKLSMMRLGVPIAALALQLSMAMIICYVYVDYLYAYITIYVYYMSKHFNILLFWLQSIKII